MSLLDGLLGIQEILSDGVAVEATTRALNFTDGASATFNPVTGKTDVKVASTSYLTSDLPVGVDEMIIVASGRSFAGDGGGGLLVFDAESTATPDNATVWQVGGGSGRWLRVTDGNVLNVRWFGAHPSATADANATAIQAAIDRATDIHVADHRIIHIPAGRYQIARTIHLGPQTPGFACLELRGDGYAYLGEGYGGTSLIATFSNAPLINVQGARGSIVRDMALLGPNRQYILTNLLGQYGVTPLKDERIAANWWSGLLSANGNTRYAPSAGISIDGWSGSAPGTSYPTTHIPYGLSFSSDVMIENCNLSGFNVAIVNQPCDADGNGDFTLIRRCNISECVYGISVGNTQSRQVGIQDCKIALVHTVLTNNKHGKQLGKFNGTVDNLSFGACYQLFDFSSSAYFGPLKFTSCYSESLYRLGNYSANSSTEQGVSFEECQFGFELHDVTYRPIPAVILTGGQQPTALKFSRCSFGNYVSTIVFNQQDMVIEDCLFFSRRLDATPTKEYMGIFHNATGDGAMLQNGLARREQRIKFERLNIDTMTRGGGNTTSGCADNNTRRSQLIPIWSKRATNYNDMYDEQPVYRATTTWDKTSLTSVDLTHGPSSSTDNIGVLTIVFPSATLDDAENYGYAPGDMIIDDVTQSVFVIRSFASNTCVAELQNNYTISGGNYTTDVAFSETVGNLYFHVCRYYTPSYHVLADVTSGSATLASTGRDDGYAGFISSGGVPDQIKVGDRVSVAATIDNWIYHGSNKVSAIAADGTSITMTGASARTVSRKRLPIWVRKPPANEGSR